MPGQRGSEDDYPMNRKYLRIIIPLAAGVIGLLIILSQFSSPGTRRPTDQAADSTGPVPRGAAAPQPAAPTAIVADPPQLVNADPEDQNAATRELAAGTGAPTAENHASTDLKLVFAPQPPQELLPIGSLDSGPDNGAAMLVEFSPLGAGIRQITLRDEYESIGRNPDNRYTLFKGLPIYRPALALRRLIINSQEVKAFNENQGIDQHFWKQIAPGQFEAVIIDESDAAARPVLTIRRYFKVGPAKGQITVEQSITNHTDKPITVKIEQWGPGDLAYVPGGYGDFRRIRFGYVDQRDTSVSLADESDFLQQRRSVVKSLRRSAEHNKYDPVLWPNDTSRENNYSLSWVAMTNRYFTFAVYPQLDDLTAQTVKVLSDIEQVTALFEGREKSLLDIDENELATRYLSLKLEGSTQEIGPNGVLTFDLGAYAGALRKSVLTSEQPYRYFNLVKLVVYQLGCALCTFQPLAHFLLWFLRLIEGEVLGIGTGDWALAIIILVLCVRALLHPITKKGQISMQRTAKRMAALQPEIKKIKEKYADNPKKAQVEQTKLMRERNVNPAGCLGMVPMFLQTPIWIALYAMLYFAIELRQEPGFYGIFQLFGGWSFLADLSQPDHFFDFGRPIFENIRYLGNLPIIGSLSSINLLPFLMAVIFFVQQKYLTPTNPNMTPEQLTTQKIQRIMIVGLFPIFLYNAPSGLTLYIITSSLVGTLESKYIRAHIDALDLEEEVKKPVKGKSSPGRKKVQNKSKYSPGLRGNDPRRRSKSRKKSSGRR